MKLRLSFVIVFPVLLILGFIIYSPALSAPFIFDDYEFIIHSPLARDFAALWADRQTAGLKFLTYATFVLNFVVGGQNPFGYHLLNIVFHIINAGLVYLLVGQLLRTTMIVDKFNDEQKNLLPFVTSLVFLAHPVATSAVTYVWQRAELLTAMFYLGALICYVIARQDKKKFYLIGTALCFVVGMFAKGTMISLPLMLVLLECALWPVSRRKAYTIILSFGFFFFFKAYMLLWEEPWSSYTRFFPLFFMKLTGTIFSYEQVWTQVVVTVKYFVLALLPIGQNFDHAIPLVSGAGESRVVIATLILVWVIIAACVLWNKRRLLSVGIFWFLIALLPAALLAGREPMWEYRMYLPLAGLMIGMIAFIFCSLDLRKAVLCAVCIAVIFSVLSFARNRLWQSTERLLLDSISKGPQNPNTYQLLGAFYLQAGRINDAEKYLEKTIALAPDAAESYNNLALIAKNRGDIARAREMFETAIHIRPTLTGAYINLAYLLLGEGEEAKAEETLRQSLAVQETEGAYAALGKLYLTRGRLDEAESFLKKALLINPQASQIYFWYGELWVARQEPDKAREMFKQAERFNPRLQGMVSETE